MPAVLRDVDARTLHVWDGLVLFWVALWLVLGVWTGVALWRAADAGDTISGSGSALSSVGHTLQNLSQLPLVPDKSGEIGGQVVGAADDITTRGQAIKGQLRQLSLLLGIAIIGIPITPVLGLYLPVRLLRRREVRQIVSQLRRSPDDDGLDRYLADHARLTLSYDTVARLDAASEGTDDRTRRLADAELARLGVRRPARA